MVASGGACDDYVGVKGWWVEEGEAHARSLVNNRADILLGALFLVDTRTRFPAICYGAVSWLVIIKRESVCLRVCPAGEPEPEGRSPTRPTTLPSQCSAQQAAEATPPASPTGAASEGTRPANKQTTPMQQAQVRSYGLSGAPNLLDTISANLLSALLHPSCADPLTLFARLMGFEDTHEEHMGLVGVSF